MRKYKLLLAISILMLFSGLTLVPGTRSQYDAPIYEWPKYRHDLRGTGYTPSPAPVAAKLQWNVTTGSPICSSAAVVDGKLYIGAGCSEERNVLCLDAFTGTVIWNQTVDGYLCSSPTVECGKVYTGLMWDESDPETYGGVCCLDANTGSILWSRMMGDGQNQVVSSPAVFECKVFIGGQGGIYCYDASTGDPIWNYPDEGGTDSSPAVSNGKVYIGLARPAQPENINEVCCLDANTGKLIWNYTTDGPIWASPAVVNGKVFIATFSGGESVYCLDAETGVKIWDFNVGEGFMSSPAVAYGNVYIGTEYNAELYCLDADTGGPPKWIYPTEDEFIHHSSPAVGRGKVYIGAWGRHIDCPPPAPQHPGRTHCLDALTGDVIWKYDTAPDYYMSSSPAIAYGMLFTGGDYSVLALSASTVASCDIDGTETATFLPEEKVYVKGSVLPPSTDVTIYIIPNGEDASAGNAVASSICTTEADGSLLTSLVWSPPLTVGQYDIWVDINQNGALDGCDVYNDEPVSIFEFFVIPEPAVIASVLLLFGAFATFNLARKRIHKQVASR